MVDEEIDFVKIEKKWQKKWEDEKAFEVSEDKNKKKYNLIEMYPYPSASGLHMGHAFNYTIGDILSRFKKMQGFNVLHPMGYDSFGLPAENAAIKAGEHPMKYTDKAIDNFVKQQKALGLGYDWTRVVKSHDPNYYKWNQWIFLQMLKKGLAYRKDANVNWCKKCESVLANEQVHNGKCWRHSDVEVEIKPLEQWFLKTTDYADELLSGIEKLDWPNRIKAMQKNWIGRSEGTKIDFEVNGESWKVFTTRPDTLMGVTFLVISAQHPRLMDLVISEQEKEVKKFMKKIVSTKQEDMDKLDKEGVFTGAYAKHPVTGEDIPIWAGNFVLAEYGSGMVMAVPAHDARDFQFAEKYGIEIKRVISENGKKTNKMDGAYTDKGILVNSGEFDGLESEGAKEKITEFLKSKKKGKKTVNYKLRDWLVSRQRYWGTPIPIVYCDSCGIVPVDEKDLPVLLPEKVKFGEGNPLETNKEFLKVECPKCGAKARRETDTMDTFFDSSWYYLRYSDALNDKKLFDSKKANYWMPVDFYTGGAEHATMHLIYARFFFKFFRDLGLVKGDEPFMKLFNQGMVHGEDGSVMSKSAGNGVDPLTITEKYGADSLRWFLVSNASPDKDFNWSNKGVQASYRFVQKAYCFLKDVKKGKSSSKAEHKVNKAIKEITMDIENLDYNLAVIKLRQVFDFLMLENQLSEVDLKNCVKVFSLFCPHISEELWSKIGNNNFITLEDWPKVDEKKIDDNIEKAEEALDKVVEDIRNIIGIVKEKEDKDVKKAYIYTIPPEKGNYDESVLSEKLGIKIKVFAINEDDVKTGKVDPEGKAKKTKPGKPGIYVE